MKQLSFRFVEEEGDRLWSDLQFKIEPATINALSRQLQAEFALDSDLRTRIRAIVERHIFNTMMTGSGVINFDGTA